MMMRLYTLFMVFVLIITPPMALANSYSGGWTQSGKILNGLTTIYEGMLRTSDGLWRGVSSITPSLDDITKGVIRFSGAAAVSIVIDSLLDSVDYVMDTENNQVIFRPEKKRYCRGESECFNTLDEVTAYARVEMLKVWKEHSFDGCYIITRYYPHDIRCDVSYALANGKKDIRTFIFSDTTPKVSAQKVAEVIQSKASSGDTASQVFVSQVADSIAIPGQKEKDWERTKAPANPSDFVGTNTGSSTGTSDVVGTNTGSSTGSSSSSSSGSSSTVANGAVPNTSSNTATDSTATDSTITGTGNNTNVNVKLDMPAFCTWAVTLCEFIGWVKAEPELSDTNVEVKEVNLKNPSEFDRDYVNVNAQCPADVIRNIPIGPNSFKLVFEMSPICDFASNYLKPVVIFMSYVYGALMIGTAIRVD